ncbi:MAG: hypothetical protein IJY65_05020 [Clostridia bacterium]|nr:hypothetical protein [Clostridia bacterium]
MTDEKDTVAAPADMEGAESAVEELDPIPPSNAPTQTPTGEEITNEPASKNDAFAALERADLLELIRDFPELSDKKSLSEIENPARYGVLRELGLSPKEAYLASSFSRRADNRAHLHSSVPARAAAPDTTMSAKELEGARELFSGLSDSEIRSLYKRVTK